MGFSDFPGFVLSDDDKVRLEQLKEVRDGEFWNRVRDIGLRAFWELGGRRITRMPENMDSQDIPAADRSWIAANGTFPPQGNLIAAQLLGFKLQFYASDLRDDSSFPDNLIWLAALLIHIGFISLRDLYPHLHPADEGMADFKQKLQKEKDDRDMKMRPGGGMNALTMAAALFDDTAPPSKAKDLDSKPTQKPGTEAEKAQVEEDQPKADPENQKLKLLKALLLIGAIPDALFILGRFPWLMDVCPDLTPFILRILNYSLSKVVSELQPLKGRDSVRRDKANVVEQPSLPKGELAMKVASYRRVLKWGHIDTVDSTKESDYKFYWEEWSDSIPVCRSVDDVLALCSSFMNILGVRIGEDAELVTNLARIGCQSVLNDKSPSNIKRWIDLCKRLLVPSLSFTGKNPGPVNAIWNLIKTFSIEARYSIYAEWYRGRSSRTPEMRVVFELARIHTRDIMKRISKQNAREMAKSLAKITYGSPGIVFTVALSQIESYNNLIAVVVECARYFTNLAFDVLTYSILSSLGASGRNLVQGDGMLTSPWLRALSQFAGTCFRRYSHMSPSPLLQYIAQQLRSGKTECLEILEQIITSMAGIRADTHYGDEQIRNMAGGPLLREMTLKQVLDKRHESKLQSKRLIKALLETNLAGQLLILIGQEHQNYVYREQSESAPLKVVANNTDKIYHAFVQYLDTLASGLSNGQFQTAIPSVDRLIRDFKLAPGLAFAIHRDNIRLQMEEVESTEPEKDDKSSNAVLKSEAQATTSKASAPEGDVKMTDALNTLTESRVEDTAKDIGMTDTQIDAGVTGSLNTVLERLMEALHNALGQDFEKNMSLAFYTRFWQMSLYDMSIPKYDNEIKTLKARLASVNADRKDNSPQAVRKRDAEKRQLLDLLEGINKEMKAHLAHYQAIRRKLSKEKILWFSTPELSTNAAVADGILQECILPRAILSVTDAIYCYKMLFLTHQMGTPGFRTIQVFDRLFRDQFLRQWLFQCTPLEAENFGRFLNEVLKEFSIWHQSKETYEKNAWGTKNDLPGFCLKLKPDLTPELRLEYEDFRRLLFKWHGKLHSALKGCLMSDEYMHLKNAVILLKAIHQDFPKVSHHGTSIIEAVTSVSRSDPREDLKVTALSLLGGLNKRKAKWVLPQDFRISIVPDVKPREESSSTLAPVAKTALDPKAPDSLPSKAS